MRISKKKGFTIVELVIVVAIIAVLASVLIPTFSSIVDKANESVYLQEKTNQGILDAIEKIENSDYLTWEEFESALIDELKKIVPLSLEEVQNAIEDAINDYNSHQENQNTGLTKEQIEQIIEHALKDLEGLTEEEIDKIIDEIRDQICAINVTGVTLDSGTLSLTPGGTAALSATVAPADATKKDVTWSSNNTDVATVDQNGNITAVAAGTATITVTTVEGNFTATCEVTVKQPVTGITLNVTEVTLKPGETATLTATISPGDASNQWIYWASSNYDVAGFEGWDWISGAKTVTVACEEPGTTTITATTSDGGYIATCTITVVSPADQLEADLESGKDVTMTENLTVHRITIPENAGEVTLDLGGQTLTCTEIVISDNSTLTIRNGALSVQEKVVVNSNGTLKVDHVAVTSSGGSESVRNYGNATITNSSFTTENTSNAKLLVNNGTMSLNNCTLTSTTKTTNDRTFVISNNTPENNPAGANLTLTNVTVVANFGCVTNTVSTGAAYNSTVTISGGSYTTKTFTSGYSPVFLTGDGCTLTLKDKVQIYAQSGGTGTLTGTAGTDYEVHTIS